MHFASLLACATVLVSAFTFGQSGFTKKVTPMPYGTGGMYPLDFNRDGHTDLLMPAGDQLVVAFNNGSGDFSQQYAYSNPADASAAGYFGPIAVADFNGDGYPDVAACSNRNNGPYLEVFLNQGGTALALKQTIKLSQQCTGLAAIDTNHDGKWDLVVGEANTYSNIDSGLRVFLGSGTGTFNFLIGQSLTLTDPQQPTSTCSLSNLAAADFQGVGRYDLVLMAYCIPTNSPFSYGAAFYAVRNSDGTYAVTFANELPGTGSMQLLNVNHDLKPDLLLTLGNSGPLASSQYSATVMLNQGNETFSVITADAANTSDGCGTIIFNAAGGDLNGDGYADVVDNWTNNNPDGNCDSSAEIYGFNLLKGSSSNAYSLWQTWPGQRAGGIAIADVNNDNRNDFLVNYGGSELDVYLNTQSFSPSTSCKPKGAGPTLCTPLAGSDYPNTVNFQATGVGVTGPVRLMQLWIDGKKVGQYAGNFFNKTFNLANGTRTVTVVHLEFNGQSWRTAQKSFKVN